MPSTRPRIRSGTSSTPPSSSCAMSSSSRRACAVRRRSRWRASSGRRRSWPARRSTRRSARSGRPIIWQKKRSAMPSARMPAATARTTGTERAAAEYGRKPEGADAPSGFCCVCHRRAGCFGVRGRRHGALHRDGGGADARLVQTERLNPSVSLTAASSLYTREPRAHTGGGFRALPCAAGRLLSR